MRPVCIQVCSDDSVTVSTIVTVLVLQGGGGGDQQQKQQERAKQMEDMKNGILSQILDQKARARLNTLMIAKPDKGRQVEAMLCQMAQSGQLGGKLGDDELKGLLDR